MNAIEIKDLNKSYKNFQLKNIDLTLPGGCIMGLIGENGAGKSTLIHSLLDIIHKDSGSVSILGKSHDDNFVATKQDIGVVLDEVGLPESLNAKQIGKIMSLTFDRWNDQQYFEYLEKMSVPADKKFKALSKGMKMKLGIAIALSHGAKLLILDEPTSGLDPVVRNDVVEYIRDFVCDDQHSVLISSHIVSDLEKLCDYVAFIHKGEILVCEEKDLLLEKYAILHCTSEQLSELDPDAIISKRETPYGIEAVVLRDLIPAAMTVSPIGIEELFVLMIKEGI